MTKYLLILLATFNCYAVTITSPTSFDESWSDVINTVQTNKSTTILWRGHGGSADEGQKVINAFIEARRQGHQINIVVVGVSQSMHAFAACAGSTLTIKADLLFHRGSQDMTSDGNSVSIYTGNGDLEGIAQSCLARGIINRSDLKKIEAGQELWIGPNGYKNFEKDERDINQ